MNAEDEYPYWRRHEFQDRLARIIEEDREILGRLSERVRPPREAYEAAKQVQLTLFGRDVA